MSNVCAEIFHKQSALLNLDSCGFRVDQRKHWAFDGLTRLSTRETVFKEKTNPH